MSTDRPPAEGTATPAPLREPDEFARWMTQWHRAIGGRPANLLYSGDTVRAAFYARQEEIDRLLSEKEQMRSALARFVEITDEECRLDHNGYCQSHYVERADDCTVAAARRLLGLSVFHNGHFPDPSHG